MRVSISLLCSTLLLTACDNDSTPNRAPVFGAANATASVAENSIATGYIAVATDAPGQSLTYAIAGGPDAAAFELAATGELSFVAGPDFESPSDADGDNRFEVTIEVEDPAGLTATQAVEVIVEDTNEAPDVTSAAAATALENTTGVIYQAAASDPEGDTISYSLATGGDNALFSVSSTGAVSLLAPLDFEIPTDVDIDGVYRVDIVASDGVLTAAPFALDVAITDEPFSHLESVRCARCRATVRGSGLGCRRGDGRLCGVCPAHEPGRSCAGKRCRDRYCSDVHSDRSVRCDDRLRCGPALSSRLATAAVPCSQLRHRSPWTAPCRAPT